MMAVETTYKGNALRIHFAFYIIHSYCAKISPLCRQANRGRIFAALAVPTFSWYCNRYNKPFHEYF